MENEVNRTKKKKDRAAMSLLDLETNVEVIRRECTDFTNAYWQKIMYDVNRRMNFLVHQMAKPCYRRLEDDEGKLRYMHMLNCDKEFHLIKQKYDTAKCKRLRGKTEEEQQRNMKYFEDKRIQYDNYVASKGFIFKDEQIKQTAPVVKVIELDITDLHLTETLGMPPLRENSMTAGKTDDSMSSNSAAIIPQTPIAAATVAYNPSSQAVTAQEETEETDMQQEELEEYEEVETDMQEYQSTEGYTFDDYYDDEQVELEQASMTGEEQENCAGIINDRENSPSQCDESQDCSVIDSSTSSPSILPDMDAPLAKTASDIPESYEIKVVENDNAVNVNTAPDNLTRGVNNESPIVNDEMNVNQQPQVRSNTMTAAQAPFATSIPENTATTAMTAGDNDVKTYENTVVEKVSAPTNINATPSTQTTATAVPDTSPATVSQNVNTVSTSVDGVNTEKQAATEQEQLTFQQQPQITSNTSITDTAVIPADIPELYQSAAQEYYRLSKLSGISRQFNFNISEYSVNCLTAWGYTTPDEYTTEFGCISPPAFTGATKAQSAFDWIKMICTTGNGNGNGTDVLFRFEGEHMWLNIPRILNTRSLAVGLKVMTMTYFYFLDKRQPLSQYATMYTKTTVDNKNRLMTWAYQRQMCEYYEIIDGEKYNGRVARNKIQPFIDEMEDIYAMDSWSDCVWEKYDTVGRLFSARE